MPSYVIAGLYLALLIAAAFRLGCQWDSARIIRDLAWRGALVAFVIVPFAVGPRISGLEYEDAYVHIAAGLFQAANFGDGTDGYYTRVCLAGPVADCVIDVTFGTHLIGYSTAVAGTHLLVGDRSGIGNFISIGASAIAIQVTWSLLCALCGTSVARLTGIAVVLTAPAFHVLSGSTFAEPLFAMLLVCNLYGYVNATRQPAAGWQRVAVWAFFAASGALMIAVKKEGVLLTLMLVFAFAFDAYRFLRRERAASAQALVGLGVTALTVVYALALLRIGDAASRHSADIGTSAFSLSFVTSLLPALLSAALSIENFGVTGFVAILAAVYAFIRRDPTSCKWVVVIAGYIALYTMHARHAPFVDGATVDPREMIRYAFVLLPLAGFLIASAAERLSTSSSQRKALYLQWSVQLALCCGLVVASWEARNQRIRLADDEREVRVGPVYSSGSLDRVVIISPTSVAVFAVGGIRTVAIDVKAIANSEVRWVISEYLHSGRRLVIDKRLCAVTTQADWKAACDRAEQGPQRN